MPVQIERFRNEPILLLRYLPPFDVREDMAKASEETAKALREIQGTVYRIEDVTGIDVNFSNIVQGMGAVTKKDDVGSIRNERVHLIMVSEKFDMLKIVKDGFKQDQYGNLDMSMFKTVDEALRFARSR